MKLKLLLTALTCTILLTWWMQSPTFCDGCFDGDRARNVATFERLSLLCPRMTEECTERNK